MKENEYIGASGHLEPKQEERSTCMFGNQSASVRGETVNHGASVYTQDGGFKYQNPPVHVWTHSSSTDVSWNQTQHPGSWRSGNSLSSNDLEMDREPSMAPFSQIMSPGSNIPGVDTSKIPLTDVQLRENISRYPHEDKLMRYDGQTVSDFSNHQHQMWQQNIQQTSLQPKSAKQYCADDTMDDDENITYSVEVDEYGEGFVQYFYMKLRLLKFWTLVV